MATVISKTIGTGGDYTSVQSWDDASPVNLVTANQIWEGLVLNEKLTPPSTIMIGGSTANASCYKHLTVQAGASFVDNLAHPLMYDEANGAMIYASNTYDNILSIDEAYVKVSRLQIGKRKFNIYVGGSGTNITVDSCILYSDRAQTIRATTDSTLTIINSVILNADIGDLGIILGGGNFYGCTFANLDPSAASAAFVPDYQIARLYNCVFANVTFVAKNKPTQVICDTCYTTGSSHSGCTIVALDETTGTGFVDATMDFTGNLKLNPTSALVGSAVVHAPYTDDDIYGTLRGADPDVGAYEIPASGGATHPSTGSVVGNTATVTGTAARSATVQTHPSTGVVVGNTSTVIGTAKRYRLHTTTGAVTGLTSTVTGSATIQPAPGIHVTSGDVVAGVGTVTGSAKHVGVHTTTGVLAGFSAEVVGAAQRSGAVIVHSTSGVLAGYDSVVTGAATNQGSMTLTPADIQAIVAALKAEILPVDIVRVNHIDVDGTGADSDPWGPV